MSDFIKKGLISAIFPELEKGSFGANLVEADSAHTQTTDHILVKIIPTKPRSNNLCGNKYTYRWIVQVTLKTKKLQGSLAISEFEDSYINTLTVNTDYLAEENIYTLVERGYPSAEQFKANGWFQTPIDFLIQHIED